MVLVIFILTHAPDVIIRVVVTMPLVDYVKRK